MGTTYRIKVVAPPAGVTRESLQPEVDTILERIDRQFSTYRDDSEISRFNRMDSTDWQPASEALVTVVNAARDMSHLSDGAFDVTALPLATLWGFGPLAAVPRVPQQAEIRRTLRIVGYQKLEHRHEPPALRKRKGRLQLDANALVAGYAADLVATRFEQLGLRNYLVDMGGEFRLRGRNASGEAWHIAIEQPLPDRHKIARVLRLTDCAISTSGNYRDFFEIKGKRYSHNLDVRSGWPVRHKLASVTVIAPTALQADAWSTALLVLGEEQGIALAEREEVAALMITGHDSEFDERPSTAFRAYLAAGADPVRTASPRPGLQSPSGKTQALR